MDREHVMTPNIHQIISTTTSRRQIQHQNKAQWFPTNCTIWTGPSDSVTTTTAIVTSSDASPAPRRAALGPSRPCPALVLPQPAPSLSLMLSGLTHTPIKQRATPPYTPNIQNKHHHYCTSSVLLTCHPLALSPASPLR